MCVGKENASGVGEQHIRVRGTSAYSGGQGICVGVGGQELIWEGRHMCGWVWSKRLFGRAGHLCGEVSIGVGGGTACMG